MITVKKNRLHWKLLAISSAAILVACGGGDEGSDSKSSSTYINFSGNSNGETVVDANNRQAKFRTATRLMEVDGVVSDVLLDNNNNLLRGASQNIGTVQLVGSTSGQPISGMVGTDGTMLAIENKAGGGITLGKSNVVPANPNSGSATGGTGSGNATGGSGTGGSGSSGGSSGSGSSLGSGACGNAKYPGDSSDPQVYSFDAVAQSYQCLYRATKDSTYITQGNTNCRVLDGLLRSTAGKFTPMFCKGPLMIL